MNNILSIYVTHFLELHKLQVCKLTILLCDLNLDVHELSLFNFEFRKGMNPETNLSLSIKRQKCKTAFYTYYNICLYTMVAKRILFRIQIDLF